LRSILLGWDGSQLAEFYLEQDGTWFGADAENTELNLRADLTFEIKLGKFKQLSEAWPEYLGGPKSPSCNKANIASCDLRDGKLVACLSSKDAGLGGGCKSGNKGDCAS
jgi:hypothetical protein